MSRGISALPRVCFFTTLLVVTLHCSDSGHKLADLKTDGSTYDADGILHPDAPAAVADTSGGGAVETGGSDGAVDGKGQPATCANPPTGCCFVDSDCKPGFECAQATCTTATQAAGVCEYTVGLAPGQSWRDADCPAGSGGCGSPSICPCGFSCAAPDGPGTCRE